MQSFLPSTRAGKVGLTVAIEKSLGLQVNVLVKDGLKPLIAQFQVLGAAQRTAADAGKAARTAEADSARAAEAEQKKKVNALLETTRLQAEFSKATARDAAIAAQQAEKDYRLLVSEEARAQKERNTIAQQSARQREEYRREEVRFEQVTYKQEVQIARQAEAEKLQAQQERNEKARDLLTTAGFAGAAIGAAGLGLSQESLQASTDLESQLARLKAITGSAEGANAELAVLRDTAQEFGFDQNKLVDSYSSLAIRLKDTGVTTSQTDALFKNLTITARALNLSSDTLSGSLTQLSQGLGSGALRGDELRSVTEAGLISQKDLAAALGINISQLKDYAAQGKITTDVVLAAAKATSDKLLPAAKESAKTYEAATERFGNTAKIAEEQIGQGLAPAAAALLGVADTLLKVFNILPDSAQAAIAVVIALAGAVGTVVGALATLDFFIGGKISATVAKFVTDAGGLGGALKLLTVDTLAAAAPFVAIAAGIALAAAALYSFKFAADREGLAATLGKQSEAFDKINDPLSKYIARLKEGGPRNELYEASVRKQVAALKSQGIEIKNNLAASDSEKAAVDLRAQALDSLTGRLDKATTAQRTHTDAIKDTIKALKTEQEQIETASVNQQAAVQKQLNNQAITDEQYKAALLKNNRERTSDTIANLEQQKTAYQQAALSTTFTEEERAKEIGAIDKRVASERLSLLKASHDAELKLRTDEISNLRSALGGQYSEEQQQLQEALSKHEITQKQFDRRSYEIQASAARDELQIMKAERADLARVHDAGSQALVDKDAQIAAKRLEIAKNTGAERKRLEAESLAGPQSTLQNKQDLAALQDKIDQTRLDATKLSLDSIAEAVNRRYDLAIKIAQASGNDALAQSLATEQQQAQIGYAIQQNALQAQFNALQSKRNVQELEFKLSENLITLSKANLTEKERAALEAQDAKLGELIATTKELGQVQLDAANATNTSLQEQLSSIDGIAQGYKDAATGANSLKNATSTTGGGSGSGVEASGKAGGAEFDLARYGATARGDGYFQTDRGSILDRKGNLVGSVSSDGSDNIPGAAAGALVGKAGLVNLHPAELVVSPTTDTLAPLAQALVGAMSRGAGSSSISLNQDAVVAKLDRLQAVILKVAAQAAPITIHGSDNPIADASQMQREQLKNALRGAGL